MRIGPKDPKNRKRAGWGRLILGIVLMTQPLYLFREYLFAVLLLETVGVIFVGVGIYLLVGTSRKKTQDSV